MLLVSDYKRGKRNKRSELLYPRLKPGTQLVLGEATKKYASRFFQLKVGQEVVEVFLERIGAVETAECWWCGQAEQSVIHLYAKCRKWRKGRVLKRELGGLGIGWQYRPEKRWSIVPHTRSRWVFTRSTSYLAQRRIFRYLPSTFNAQLLHNMAFNSYATEARVREACDAIHDGSYTNCTQAASAYNVPICRLQRRWNKSASKSTQASTNKALTEEQEGAIREYIDRLDKINICAYPQMIVGAANYLIRFENRVVGHQWLK